MLIYRMVALSLILFPLTACSSLHSKQPNPQVIRTIEVLQKADWRTKVEGGIKMQDFVPLVEEVNHAVKQIPADTDPKVMGLLQGSADAYNLEVDYWRCGQGTADSYTKYKCKDSVIEEISAKFPLLKRNFEHRLAAQKTSPKYTSLLIKDGQMFSLLVMQAEVNRIDAQTLLAQANSTSVFTFTPNKLWLLSRVFNSTTFWLLSGVIFGLIELFLPETLAKKYRLFSLILGITSLIVAFLSWRTSRLLEFQIQLIYWTGLSVACVLWVRPMLLKRKKFTIQDSAEALTLTEILPGQTGRVLYEGISWQACCESQSKVIAPQTKVYVLRREGNTLIVEPENLFHSE